MHTPNESGRPSPSAASAVISNPTTGQASKSKFLMRTTQQEKENDESFKAHKGAKLETRQSNEIFSQNNMSSNLNTTEGGDSSFLLSRDEVADKNQN